MNNCPVDISVATERTRAIQFRQDPTRKTPSCNKAKGNKAFITNPSPMQRPLTVITPENYLKRKHPDATMSNLGGLLCNTSIESTDRLEWGSLVLATESNDMILTRAFLSYIQSGSYQGLLDTVRSPDQDPFQFNKIPDQRIVDLLQNLLANCSGKESLFQYKFDFFMYFIGDLGDKTTFAYWRKFLFDGYVSSRIQTDRSIDSEIIVVAGGHIPAPVSKQNSPTGFVPKITNRARMTVRNYLDQVKATFELKIGGPIYHRSYMLAGDELATRCITNFIGTDLTVSCAIRGTPEGIYWYFLFSREIQGADGPRHEIFCYPPNGECMFMSRQLNSIEQLTEAHLQFAEIMHAIAEHRRGDESMLFSEPNSTSANHRRRCRKPDSDEELEDPEPTEPLDMSFTSKTFSITSPSHKDDLLVSSLTLNQQLEQRIVEMFRDEDDSIRNDVWRWT